MNPSSSTSASTLSAGMSGHPAKAFRLKQILLITFLVLMTVPAGKVLFSWRLDPSTQEKLERAVQVLNKNAPMMLDEVTRLDGADLVEGQQIEMRFALPDDVVPTDYRGQFEQVMRKSVLGNACSTALYLDLLKGGARIGYSYRDSTGEVVSHFQVTRADCL